MNKNVSVLYEVHPPVTDINTFLLLMSEGQSIIRLAVVINFTDSKHFRNILSERFDSGSRAAEVPFEMNHVTFIFGPSRRLRAGSRFSTIKQLRSETGFITD